MSRSASSSTYTWHTPSPVRITGTLASFATARMRPAPPRGISTSTYPSRCISSLAVSWEVSCTREMQSAGRPACSRAWRISSVTQRLDRMASLPPRRMHTFPDLRHSAAASTVTLGRASKMMAMTPRGTRRRPMMRPLGRLSILSTLPMGSGRAATCRTPSTMPAIRSAFSVSRSSMAGRIPASFAAATSAALAESHSSCRSVRILAMASRAAFFFAVPAVERV